MTLAEMQFVLPDLRLAGAETFILAMACLTLIVDLFVKDKKRTVTFVLTQLSLIGAAIITFSMANAGLPATSGFVGEFMVILAAVKYNFWVAFAAATTMIVGAAYTLWMYKRVVFGNVGNHHVAELSDINAREFLVLALLAFGALGMGLYPQPFTEVMHSSVNELLRHIAVSKIL